MTIDKGEYRIGYEGIIKGKGWPGLSSPHYIRSQISVVGPRPGIDVSNV